MQQRTRALLVMHALNSLPDSSAGEEPCCSNCCGPCEAIAALLPTGELDAAVMFDAKGYDWWDEGRARVRREYLKTRLRPSCETCRGDAL